MAQGPVGKTRNYLQLQFPAFARHPLNVRPSGNELILLEAEQRALRDKWNGQLGSMAVLPDDLIMQIISYLDRPGDVVSLGHASRVLYAFTYHEEVWKTMFLRQAARLAGDFEWRGSWRRTVLRLDREARVQCENNLVCSDLLFRPFQCSQMDYKSIFKQIVLQELAACRGGAGVNRRTLYAPIRRIAEETLSVGLFEETLSETPFILTSSSKNRWPRWTLETLLERFPKVEFQQEAVNWSLEAYSRYLAHNEDESPLYLFDCNSSAMQELASEYTVPQCFQKDLFKVFDEEAQNRTASNCRPNFRWLIVGSERTGSTFHKDPNSTSAWNAVLSGSKLWIMVPPHLVPPGVDTNADESEVTSPVSLAEYVLSGFFQDVLKLSADPSTGVLIGITFPGECNYVPSGWWHLVINVENTVALTQNFTPVPTLPKVLSFFKNKPDQVSGFNLARLHSATESLYSRMAAQSPLDNDFATRKLAIERYLNNSKLCCASNAPVQEDEACISNVPLIHIFEQLLIENGFKHVLDAAKLKLEQQARSRESFLSKVVKRNQLWENVIKTQDSCETDKTNTAFSFNFGFDEEED